jgi:hypothetical protein
MRGSVGLGRRKRPEDECEGAAHARRRRSHDDRMEVGPPVVSSVGDGFALTPGRARSARQGSAEQYAGNVCGRRNHVQPVQRPV